MMTKEIAVKNSYPILAGVGAVLCIGKAFGLADIEWWQATMPFWIGPAFLMFCMAIALATACAAQLLVWLLEWLTRRNLRKAAKMRAKRDAERRARMN